MKRKIIQIDEEKCNGSGQCIPECREGALQIIDGKARLVSDMFCDGLGSCLGHCPEGAIEIVERNAEPYDEIKVLKSILGKESNTVLAHLQHSVKSSLYQCTGRSPGKRIGIIFKLISGEISAISGCLA